MENVWHHRKVAETAAKSCDICYKPSSSVLITPDNKDFFYICPSHLKDKNFAVPTDDEAAAIAERKKKEELDREIENVRKEYEEKMRKKKEKKEAKKGKKDESDSKDSKDSEQKSDAQDEKERDDKIKALTDTESAKPSPVIDDGPRVFKLHKYFYQKRLEKLRNIEIAKRNRDRLRNPTTFPSVPKNDL